MTILRRKRNDTSLDDYAKGIAYAFVIDDFAEGFSFRKAAENHVYHNGYGIVMKRKELDAFKEEESL